VAIPQEPTSRSSPWKRERPRGSLVFAVGFKILFSLLCKEIDLKEF
jgi:hypothetical protein